MGEQHKPTWAIWRDFWEQTDWLQKVGVFLFVGIHVGFLLLAIAYDVLMLIH